jgi:hypothetical protein
MPLLARPVDVREKNIILRRLAEYALLFVIAGTRTIAVPIKPFIDFRF